VGTDSGLQYQESVGNLQPTGIAATSEQRYFTDSNILSIPDCGHPLLATPRGFGKVQHFVDDSQQAIPLEQKGREIAKKYTAENGGSRERFPAGLFQPA